MLCTVCCQFSCPFHSLICDTYQQHLCCYVANTHIYVMITFVRCWCACAYMCNVFFLLFNILSFSFNSTSIYLSTLPAVLVSLFGIFFFFFLAERLTIPSGKLCVWVSFPLQNFQPKYTLNHELNERIIVNLVTLLTFVLHKIKSGTFNMYT